MAQLLMAKEPIKACWAQVLRLGVLRASLAAVQAEQVAAARHRSTELKTILLSREPAAEAARLLHARHSIGAVGWSNYVFGGGVGASLIGQAGPTAAAATAAAVADSADSAAMTAEKLTERHAAAPLRPAQAGAEKDEGVLIHPSLMALHGEGRQQAHLIWKGWAPWFMGCLSRGGVSSTPSTILTLPPPALKLSAPKGGLRLECEMECQMECETSQPPTHHRWRVRRKSCCETSST